MRTGVNIVANVGGRLWAALMSFAFVPVYIGLLGIEAYGLIGFLSTILVFFTVLDLGMSTSVNREVARLGASDNPASSARDVLRTLEIVYWVIGAVQGIALAAAAPVIARDWLSTRGLGVEETIAAIRIMGLVAFLRWPVSLYMGAMMGSGRHVRMNLIVSFGLMLQSGGAALVLWLVSPTITAFALSQVVGAAILIASLVAATWAEFPSKGERARFRPAAVRPMIGMSATLALVSLVSAVVMWIDRLFLSGRVPLAEFGYYSLSSSIGSVLWLASQAFFGVLFPRFTALVTRGDHAGIELLYHRVSQCMAVVFIPAGIALALFPADLLSIYTNNADVAVNASGLLRLHAIAYLLQALIIPAVALQLASGWSSLTLWKYAIALAIYVPVLFLLVPPLGATGAALGYLGVSLGFFLIEIPVMHGRLLPGRQWRWYFVDLLPATMVAGIVLGCARLLVTGGGPSLATLFVIVGATLTAVLLSAAIAPLVRAPVLALLGRATPRVANGSI